MRHLPNGANTPERSGAFLRPALAGAAATLAGIGLARFSYVPLFPAMVAARWIDGGGAGLIGAANLSGYLLGALGGRMVARRLGTARALDVGMAAAALAFAACAWNGGLLYLALWRALAGGAGGILMTLAGPAVQWAVSPIARGRAGGVVVAGVGTGVVVSALIVPLALLLGVPGAWLCLSALATILWAFAHSSWPDAPMPPTRAPSRSSHGAARLLLAYGLSGGGMVSHMVYLSDFAVRGRLLGTAAGAWVWLLFGVGAICGTLAGGRACDRWGASRSLSTWLVIQTLSLAAALLPSAAALGATGFFGGFAGIGISAVALARAKELAGAHSNGLWAGATAAYAAAQAATAFLLAALFARTDAYSFLFGSCLVLSLLALAVSAAPNRQ